MTAPAVVRPVDLLDTFTVPSELEATGPAESRGLARDEVRLMVSDTAEIRHRRFNELGSELRPGDLLVVNRSSTLPSSVVVDQDRALHFSTTLPGGLHLVELRRPLGAFSVPHDDPRPGTIPLPGGGRVELLSPFPVATPRPRLWVARLELGRALVDYLDVWGRPIRYRHTEGPYPIAAYQTVFAQVPGSAEMPSAGRPFSERLVTSLIGSGVEVAPVVLHTGVSSLESGEAPYPEWFEVPEITSGLIDHTHRNGGRVIAVGTTVVRALETTADSGGGSHPGRSWTDLVIGRGTELRVVDGLITGWHQPESTHLELLESVAGRERMKRAHQTALENGYLWHEFGDSHLILPG
jgi:S-adenosylmethionine:tRNA ribosyltransferase-isomerase